MANQLLNLRVSEGTLCPEPANPGARIAFFKMAPRVAKEGDDPESFEEIQQRQANQEALSELWRTLDTFDWSVRQIVNSDVADKEARINESLNEMLTFLQSAVPEWAAGNTVNKGGNMPTDNTPDLSKLDKAALLKLATETAQKLATQVAKDAERDATLKAKDEEIATLKAAAPKAEEPKAEDVLKSLAPEARAYVEKAQADAAAAIKKAEESDALAKSERDARVTKEFVDKAKVYKALPVDAAKFGPVLKRIADVVSKEDAEEIDRVLAAADAGMATALAASGQDGQGELGGDAAAEVEKRARELMSANPGMTPAVAKTQVRKADPALRKRERQELLA